MSMKLKGYNRQTIISIQISAEKCQVEDGSGI